jgi:hypothetical protein
VAEITNSFVFINIVGLTPNEFFSPFFFFNIVGLTYNFGGPPALVSLKSQSESANSLFSNKAILIQIMPKNLSLSLRPSVFCNIVSDCGIFRYFPVRGLAVSTTRASPVIRETRVVTG